VRTDDVDGAGQHDVRAGPRVIESGQGTTQLLDRDDLDAIQHRLEVQRVGVPQ